MSPPISKDWWLAAALTSAALPAAVAQPAGSAARGQSAVLTSVAPGVRESKPIYIDAAAGHRITTDAATTVHVLFSDQSAMTVGPNSDVNIAEYRFDRQANDGRILVNMTKGLLRVVGGLLSKKYETVVRTPTATIGIRGGITMVDYDGGRTTGVFLFGQSMRMTENGGSEQSVTRPGFGLSTSGDGMSPPRLIPPSELSAFLGRLNGGGQNGGGASGSPGGQSIQQVNGIAPDRLAPPGSSPPGIGPLAPTLTDVLGSQAPGNQS